MNAGNLAEIGLGWLWRMSWQASVLVLLVLVAQRIFRTRLTPGLRFGLWWLVLLRLMLPIAPESGWSVFNLARLSHSADLCEPVEKAAFVSLEPAWDETIVEPEPSFTAIKSDHPIQLQTTFSKPKPLRQADPVQPPVSKPFPIYPALAALWLAGVILYGGRLCLGSAMLSRRLRRDSASLNDAVLALFEDCRTTMGVRRSPEIIVTSAVHSPALFGFLRTKLLIPNGLAARLSPMEWRHIFLHELAHIRRRDLGMNWLMAMLQTVHWFNPMVWLAFKRMSADRELACDAMALAHARDDVARAYGLTIIKLLEGLAKPVVVPGLVGILEDKSQIKQRIHMIAKYKSSQRRPLLAALLLAALCVIAMTDAQTSKPAESAPKADKTSASDENTATPKPSRVEDASTNNTHTATNRANEPDKRDSETKNDASTIPNQRIKRLVQDGKLLWEMGQYQKADEKLREAIKEDPNCQQAFYYLNLVQEAKLAQKTRGNGTSAKEIPTTFDEPWAKPLTPGGMPNGQNAGLANIVKTSPGRQIIQSKLESIYLDEFKVLEGTELSAVIAELDTEVRKRDPKKQGINFIIASGRVGQASSSEANTPKIDPLTGAPIPADTSTDGIRDIGSDVLVKIIPALKNVPLSYVLTAITRVATIKGNNPQFHGIRFSVEEHGVEISLNPNDPNNPAETEQLVSRRFRVDPNAFIQGLESMQGSSVLPSSRQPGQNKPIDSALPTLDATGTVVPMESLTIQDYVRRFFSLATGVPFGGTFTNKPNQNGKIAIRPMFFNDRTGILYVRATLKELELLEEAVQALNVTPCQVNFEAKIFKVTQAQIQALYDAGMTVKNSQSKQSENQSKFPELTQVLDPQQFRFAQQVFTKSSQIKAYTTQNVTTIDNRQAQLVNAEGKYILDLLPSVAADGIRITIKLNLELIANSEGFVQAAKGDFKPDGALLARISTTVSVWDGDTAVLTCVSDGETNSTQKTLYILCVTPKIIDPAGNPLYGEEKIMQMKKEIKPASPKAKQSR